MKKINIENVKIKFYSEEYIYVVLLVNEEIIIKRISILDNKNIIIINTNDFNIKSFPLIESKEELNIILKDILYNLNKQYIIRDVIDINKLESVLMTNIDCMKKV